MIPRHQSSASHLPISYKPAWRGEGTITDNSQPDSCFSRSEACRDRMYLDVAVQTLNCQLRWRNVGVGGLIG